jgi:hypothetical protein
MSDPSVKVQVDMPASVYVRLRDHAKRTRSSMSRLCREGALRELERLEAMPSDPDTRGRP